MKFTRRWLLSLIPLSGFAWGASRKEEPDMSRDNVSLVYEYFPDFTRNRPLFKGDVYVGEPDKDPELFPLQVFHRQEDGSDAPVAQPLELSPGGVVTVNGSPAQIVVDGNYSIRVRDKQGSQVYYDPNKYEGVPLTEVSLPSVGLGGVGLGGVNAIEKDLRDYDVTNLRGDERLYVSGYYAPGDGGGGVFYWDATSTDADDGGVTILPDVWVDPGRWKRVIDASVSVQWFGARGDGVTDDSEAIQGAIDFAESETQDNVFSPPTTTRILQTAVVVRFPIGNYFAKSTLRALVSANSITLEGQDANRTVIFSDTSNAGYLFEVGANNFNFEMNGLSLASTKSGCVLVNCDNVSASMFRFIECQFAEYDDGGESIGIAVDYTNRSSQVTFEKCYFNRIKHPFHGRNVDLMVFDSCWFGWSPNALYADKDAYVRIDKGFCRVINCAFAGGPSQPIAGNGSETAYFNVGIEGGEAPDNDHARISIKDTRIGYETGAGALVNYFVAFDTSSSFRSGIVLENIQTSPRENKKDTIETAVSGTQSTTLIRLFEAPKQLIFDGIYCNAGRLALVTPGSTTDLTTLRAFYNVAYTGGLAGRWGNISGVETTFSLEVSNVSTDIHVYIVTGAGRTEYAEWSKLFEVHDWYYPAEDLNTSTGVIIDTDLNGADADNKRTDLSLFYVEGGGRCSVVSSSREDAKIAGYLGMEVLGYNGSSPGSEAISLAFGNLFEYAGLTRGFLVTGVFWDGVTERDTVTFAQLASHTIRLKIQNSVNPGLNTVQIDGLVIRPVIDRFPSRMGYGVVQSNLNFYE